MIFPASPTLSPSKQKKIKGKIMKIYHVYHDLNGVL